MSHGFYYLGTNARIRDGIAPGNGKPVPAIVVHMPGLIIEQWADSRAISLTVDASSWGPITNLNIETIDATLVEQPRIGKTNAREFGFTGNCCAQCGSYQMVRNGTCEKCSACGATTGCS